MKCWSESYISLAIITYHFDMVVLELDVEHVPDGGLVGWIEFV